MFGEATHVDSSFAALARDAFLLKSAERAVRSLTPEQHSIVRKHFDAAQRRATVADDLSDDRNAAVAHALYRDAVALLISAVALSRRPAEAARDGAPAAAAFDQLEALHLAGEIPAPPSFVAATRQLLSVTEPLDLGGGSPDDFLSQRKNVEKTLRWLSDLVEPRTLNEIRAARFMRLLMIAVALCIGLAWTVMRITQPVNLALGKPVTASSRHAQSGAPEDNSGLTNGEIESGYGIHTAAPPEGSFAWVMVDLQKPTRFKQINVYNRADAWFDIGLPFTLELSDDATNFNPVDTRSTGFTSRVPWTYNPPGGGTARYVRIRTSTTHLALNEVEVIR
jgi:hypothetical protein